MAPEGLSDKLYTDGTEEGRRLLGLWQRYCVSAVAENGAAAVTYESGEACAAHQVFWEGTVHVRVVGRGTQQPVPGVAVEWHGPGTNLNGTGTTDGDGFFEVYVRDEANEIWDNHEKRKAGFTETDTVTVIAEFSKGTDPFGCDGSEHKLCGGRDTVANVNFPVTKMGDASSDATATLSGALPGTGAQIKARFEFTATYLKFEHDALEVERVLHAPIVPLDGRVYFLLQSHVFEMGDAASKRPPNSAVNHEFAFLHPPTASPPASKCFLSTLEEEASTVCLHDFDMMESVVHCTNTDAKGFYHFAAPMSSRVFVEVSHKDHSFKLDTQTVKNNGGLVAPNQRSTATSAEDVTQVITVTRHHGKLRTVDFQDVTGQIIKLDAHGTRCGYPIANQATYSVRVPAKHTYCEPRSVFELDIPVQTLTTGRVMLPGHLVDVSLEALSPEWPAVTDAGDLGYFHRLRTRTRRQDLLAVSAERLQSKEDPNYTAKEPHVNYEYHPAPNMHVSLATTTGGGNHVSVIHHADCPSITATDQDLEDVAGYRAAEITVAASNHPWATNKGALVDATARVWEELPYPADSKPLRCTWIDFGTDSAGNAVAVKVRHTNRLGLSIEDRIAFGQDPTTAERKEFDTVLKETLGIENMQPGSNDITQLTRCSQEGADPTCDVPATQSSSTSYRSTAAVGGYLCEASDDAGRMPLHVHHGGARRRRRSGTVHEGVEQRAADPRAPATPGAPAGFTLALPTAACPGLLRALPGHRQWHAVPWTELTTTEQGLWQAAGATTADAYAAAADQAGDDQWATFSARVYVAASKPWAELSATQWEALVKLKFSEATWGRQWALLERIFHGDTSLLRWDELTDLEITAMVSLGWGASGMVGGRAVREPLDWDNAEAPLPGCLLPTSAATTANPLLRQWAGLAACSPAAFAELEAARLSAGQWNGARMKTRKVSGCFWHTGRLAAVGHAYVKDPQAADDTPRTRRADALEDARGRRSSSNTALRAQLCPAGQFSDPTQSYRCRACPSGWFKSDTMDTFLTCVEKPKACKTVGHVLFTAAELFGAEHESATDIDTVRTCPATSTSTPLIPHTRPMHPT